MLKKILAIVAMMYAAVAFAAVDVNKATAADLDGIKGIGPGISTKIIDERKKGGFKDWSDFIERVKGVGEGNAAKFSAEGLTVNGAGFKGMAAMPAVKAPAAAMAPAVGAKPVAAAPAVAPAAKEEKKDSKADAKAKKAEEAKAKKDAAMQAKEDAKKAKADKKADKKNSKADAAMGAASAPKK